MSTWLLALIPAYILFIVYLSVLMYRSRVAAVKSGNLSYKYFKSYQGEEPPRDLKLIANNFDSQFQVPMLFFITIIAAVQFTQVNWLTLFLGYAFFATRLWHTQIHLGKNSLKLRPSVYFAGILILLVMWIQIILTRI